MSGANTTETTLTEVDSGCLPPLPRSNLNKNPPHRSQRSERLVLVRDPPRERLARARSLAGPEETLLARVDGKQYPYRHPTTTTTTTRSSNSAVPFPSPSPGSPTIEEEFYADLYQYYYDVTTQPSNEIPLAPSGRVKPKVSSASSSTSNATSKKGKHERVRVEEAERDDGSDTERDERRESSSTSVMAKKRGSLQAIFVPSFLQTSGPSDTTASPPASPTSTTPSTTASKVVQRLRALSAVTQPSSPTHHTTFSDISPVDVAGTSTSAADSGGILPLPHQRKRSTTFSIMTSLATSHSTFVEPSSPTTPTASNHSTILSLSSRNSPPPAFLQDDDPFANLTSAPSESLAIKSLHSPLLDASPSPLPPLAHPIPRSPLKESGSLMLPSVGSVLLGGAPVPPSAPILPSTSPMLPSPLANTALPNSTPKNTPISSNPPPTASTSTSQKIKPKSAPSSPPGSASASTSTFPHPLLQTHSHAYPQTPTSPRLVPARPQPRPAHQRPAFSSRPSLPSLNTLARMNVVLTKKVRKGRVGAGLPFEPWDLPSDDESLPIPPAPLSASASSSSSARSISSHNSPVNSNNNGTMNAEPGAAASLNVNVNNDVIPSSIIPSIPIPASAASSSSVPSSPIPIPHPSPSPSLSTLTSTTTSLASGSSYLNFDSDSSSNTSTPTSSLMVAKAYTRSRPPSPSPSPLQIHNTHVAGFKPRPLLPSEILALGSVAADVEMVIPVSSRIGSGNGASGPVYSSYPHYQHQHQQQQQHPSSMTDLSNSNSENRIPPSVPVLPPPVVTAGQLSAQSSTTTGLPLVSEHDMDERVEEQPQDEEADGYFGEFLDRYQRPSRAGSEDGHGVEQGGDAEAKAEVEVEVEVEVGARSEEANLLPQRELATVGEEEDVEERDDEAEAAKLVAESTLTITIPETPETEIRDESLSAFDHSPMYGSASGEGNGDAEGEASPGLTRSDSVFSSPPSSASLSRSFSVTSDSSIGSAESGSGVEHTGRRPEDMWSYRRFANPSQSLSSLELDFDGGRGEDDIDATSVSRERGGTRSSSEDSDALPLSTPGEHDLGFFPYSHAGTFARFYQSGYSTLFSPATGASKEGGPSFLPDTGRHNLSSSSSSVDDLGGDRVAEMWERERPFSGEDMDMTMSGEGFGAEMTGRRGGFGFGFDKVLIAAEECQQGDDVEKEQESLANTTSIAPVWTTSTISRVADRLSHLSSSSDHDQPANFSLPSPPANPEVPPLDSKSVTQTLDSSGTLIDDEMLTRPHMRPSANPPARTRTTTMNPRTSSASAEPIDSSGSQRHGSSTSQHYSTRSSHGQTANYNTSGSTSISADLRNGRRGERRRNNDDEDDEEEERRRRQALERMRREDGAMKLPPSSSSSEEDNYGEPAPKSRSVPWKATMAASRSPPAPHAFLTDSSRSPSPKRMDFPASSNQSSQYATEDEREEDEDEDDDDDVPLAQRIPGALTAQKTMRRKFREEREQRKREKAERMQQSDADRRARQETLRPAGAGLMLQDGMGMPSSSSHEAAMLAASAVYPQGRQRTLTLPGKSPNSPPSAFNPHDLARKLQNVQMAEVTSPTYQQQYQYQQQHQDMQKALSPTHTRAKSLSRTSAEQSRSPIQAAPPPLPPLTAVRSRSIKDPSPTYHRPGTSPTSLPAVYGPPSGTLRPMRSFHRPSEHRSLGHDDPPPALPTDHRLGRSSTSASRPPHHPPSQPRTSGDRLERMMEPVPPLPAAFKVLQSNDESKKLVKPNPGLEPRVPSTRISGEGEHPPRLSPAQQPMPGLVNVNKVMVSQQRIFVGNLQQFHMVEIGPSTSAGDVISMMDTQGALNGWAGTGGWMVFEIAQDFGMERPVRSYELLADIQASWLKDKSVNFFVLKLTPLAAPLSRNAIPTSSPTHSGYVEWEAKRGKWSKRWLQLREHNLYLSKRDNRKDEVLICSLSNFDAYQITRNHRAPKAFSFAVKSTDNLSFFENTADYLHTFSCNEKDGKIWMEKILVARSYVLHQERQVLFKPASNNPSAAVSRSGTKKYAPVRPNHQPLVALAPNGVFEPGSLLGKHL